MRVFRLCMIDGRSRGMSIYIDNGKTIKEYATDRKIEKAIEVLLDQMGSVMSGEILKEEIKNNKPN